MSLSDSDLQALRARLQLRRADLAAAVEARLHEHGLERHLEAALPQRAQDTDDDAAASMQRDSDVDRLARLAADLSRVEHALQRCTEGDFGLCIDCGGTIEDGRLQAAPEAERCLDCQTVFERRLARGSAPRR